MLARAWYQVAIPAALRESGARGYWEITAGKMDPFLFFDQHAAANDETRQLLVSLFVHDAALDAGGNIGGDADGFAPGAHAAFYRARQDGGGCRWSLDVFGADAGRIARKALRAPAHCHRTVHVNPAHP
ncbi:MAG TPA: hypothetical protein DEP05_05860 [Betaproteobacteria bacterium]|nr:hypothetical protein [Betaproteobacteria bacterium]